MLSSAELGVHRRVIISPSSSSLSPSSSSTAVPVKLQWHIQLTVCVWYTVSSVAIVLLNKALISRFPFTFTIIVLQCATEIFIDSSIVTYRSYALHVPFTWLNARDFIQFLPVTCFFLLMLITGIEVFKFVSVVTFIAIRYFSCLVSYVGEVFLLGRPFQWEVLPSLVVILIGGAVYAAHDLEFHGIGYLLIFLNVLAHSGFSLYQKWLDVHRHYSIFTMSIYNNGLSLIVLVVCAFIASEFPSNSWNALGDTSGDTQTILIFSCIAGWSISLSGFLANTVFSATAWTLQSTLDKIPTMILSIIIFNTPVSVGIAVGAAISLVGGLMYPLTIIYLDERRKGYSVIAGEDPTDPSVSEEKKPLVTNDPASEPEIAEPISVDHDAMDLRKRNAS